MSSGSRDPSTDYIKQHKAQDINLDTFWEEQCKRKECNEEKWSAVYSRLTGTHAKLHENTITQTTAQGRWATKEQGGVFLLSNPNIAIPQHLGSLL